MREREARPAEIPIVGKPWCVIAYTDGISDVRDASGRRYSAERIAELQRELGPQPAESCCEAILSDVLDHLEKDSGVRDDMTLIVAHSREAGAAAS
jgi:serine phosphatase RsbU (regulator of sigma subunit)